MIFQNRMCGRVFEVLTPIGREPQAAVGAFARAALALKHIALPADHRQRGVH